MNATHQSTARLFARIAFLLALALLLPAAAWPQAAPWGNVRVLQAPAKFTYTVEEVYFKQPRPYKNVASKIEMAMVAVKVTIHGERFKDHATGPLVYLNRIPANAIRVSPDGELMEAYFFRPIEDLQKRSRVLRGWELIHVPYDGGDVYRIGPQGRRSEEPRELAAPPPLRLLTDAEWKHAQEIAEQYKVALPPRPPRE